METGITVIIGFLVLVSAVSTYLWIKAIRKSRKLYEEKNQFAGDLIREYDYNLIRLKIVEAEYQEFLGNSDEDYEKN